MEDEYLDVVDDNDVVVDKKLRSDVYAQHLNFRAIGLFIRNSNGELWIPRRVATKNIFPLALDLSCAGHVASGETYDETLQREVMEELNMNVCEHTVRKLGLTTPKEGYSCFGMVYEIESDTVPDYNKEDYFEYFWLSPAALEERILNEDYAKSDLIRHARRWYLNKRENGA